MKRFLPLCLSVFSVTVALSQHSKMIMSDEFKVADKEYTDQTVAHSINLNDNFYTATNSGIGGNYKWAFTKLYDSRYIVTVSKFDRNGQKTKSLELENGDRVFGPLAPRLILFNNKLCLVYFKTSTTTSFDLYLSTVNEEDLTLRSSKKICTIQQENVGIFKLQGVLDAGFVHIAQSPDHSKALVVCKVGGNNIQSFVLDNDLNIVKQASLRVSSEGFEIVTAALTNANLECWLMKSAEETKLISIAADGRKTESKINASGELLPDNTNLTVARDGKSIYVYTVTVIGLEDKHSNGLLLSQLDCATQKLSKPIAYKFPAELLETITKKGGGAKHKGDYQVYNFNPDLLELDNGNLVILGSPEQMTRSFSPSPGGDRQMATTTFDVGPVLSFSVKKASNNFDCVVIPRKLSLTKANFSGTGFIKVVQSPGVSRTYSSFTAIALGNEIAIIYDDSEKNLGRGEDEKVAEADNPKDLVLTEAFINKDNKLEYRKQIGENLKGHYTYFLGNSVPSSSTSLVFPVGKEGMGFNARKTFYTNWCYLNVN